MSLAKNIMRLKFPLFLLLILILAACAKVPTPNTTVGPVLDSFKINSREAISDFGPIISQNTKLLMIARARSSSAIKTLSLERKKNAENGVLLTTCVSSPCQYEWDISSADNGVYSFFVTIVDDAGLTLRVPYSNSLSIDIANP